MPGLISITDLDNRGVSYENTTQAQAAIDDASAVARACVEPTLDSVNTPNAPPTVVAVVVAMVRRALANPRGLAQETLGDYSYAAGSNAVATLLPTAREKRLLRKAAAAYAKVNALTKVAYGAGAIYLDGDLPAPPQDDVGLP